MNIYTTESELYDVFTKFGPLKKATIVLDAKVGFVVYDCIRIKVKKNTRLRLVVQRAGSFFEDIRQVLRSMYSGYRNIK